MKCQQIIFCFYFVYSLFIKRSHHICLVFEFFFIEIKKIIRHIQSILKQFIRRIQLHLLYFGFLHLFVFISIFLEEDFSWNRIHSRKLDWIGNLQKQKNCLKRLNSKHCLVIKLFFDLSLYWSQLQYILIGFCANQLMYVIRIWCEVTFFVNFDSIESATFFVLQFSFEKFKDSICFSFSV